jgi:hypothetical protein
MSKNPTRITVAFDQSTASLLEKISKETELSQSEIMRRALKFYNDNKALTDATLRRKAYAYMDLLLDGEHIILDVDHWLLFLQLVESSPDKERFWNEHKGVARAHREQLKSKLVRLFLEAFVSAKAIKAEITDKFTKLNVTVKPQSK